jgi:uncharacterized SAM-binding protein YcdF (DUF218 family)
MWRKRDKQLDYWDQMKDSGKKSSKQKRKKKTFLFLLACLAVLLVVLQPLLIEYGKWLSPVSDNLDTDIVVSQGAGPNNDRLNTAIYLYKAGKAKSLMTVAISDKVLQENIKQANLVSSSVYRGKCSDRTSFDNAVSTKEGIKKYSLNPKSILVVTDKYATRRIQSLFQHVLGPSIEVKVYPAKNSVQGTDESLQNPSWWNDDTSRTWVFSETQKNIFYWFYYKILGKVESVDVPFEDGFQWLTDSKIRKDSEHYQKVAEEWTTKVCGGKNE